ncbi:MAG: GGDEF domain-containing protein [Dehalobacterium sp.]
MATNFVDVAALVILCYLIYSNSILHQNRKRPFYLGIVLTVLVILAEAGTIIAGANADLRFLHIFCNVFGFAMAPLIPIILLAITDVHMLLTNKLLLLPSILNLFATVLSPWLGFVFYIDLNNHYARGDLFFIFIASYFINLIILLFSTMRIGHKHHYPIKRKITALSLFVIAGTSLQLILSSIYSSWHSVTLALLLYYLILSEFDGSFDALTRLQNRAAYDKMAHMMDGRNPKPYSVIVMDINNFKEINDTYGHDFGDTVIKKVASVIKKSFDTGYACYRVGGDEFFVISRETDPAKIEVRLKSMTHRLINERKKESRLPTVAYGYSIFEGGDAIGFQEVLKAADDQMYYYKKILK